MPVEPERCGSFVIFGKVAKIHKLIHPMASHSDQRVRLIALGRGLRI